jgi:hypothetical protein
LFRKLIVTLAAQHKLPAVYFLSDFIKDGGLISYGPDAVAPYGQAASYVDRILMLLASLTVTSTAMRPLCRFNEEGLPAEARNISRKKPKKGHRRAA